MGPYGLKRAATVSDVDALNTKADGSPILPARKAVLIHAAVVRACDRDDGIADDLIGARPVPLGTAGDRLQAGRVDPRLPDGRSGRGRP